MNALLRELLKQTSRTFYRTLHILPSAVRPQISLAYLLARTTDTIADTELVPLERRLEALQRLRQRILETDITPLDLGELVKLHGVTAERALLEQIEVSLAALRELSSSDGQLIRTVLDIITSGQELDLKRFAGASAQNIVALRVGDELDDYTYRVAGCVGEFWTRICRAHLFPEAKLNDAQLLADGVQFGKGLQLVNILRDVAVDLRKGRCYLPLDQLAEIGLTPKELMQPENEHRLRPLYDSWLSVAESHLTAGWNYTNTLPRGQMRLRLACAWPILIGVATIRRLRAENPLDPTHRIKVSRAEVRAIFARSVLLYPFSSAWANLFPTTATRAGKDVA